MKSKSVLGIPKYRHILKNYSITTLTFESTFSNGLLPTKMAPNNYKVGISRGKLNGAIIATPPYGHLYPEVYYPWWSPGLLNERERNLV